MISCSISNRIRYYCLFYQCHYHCHFHLVVSVAPRALRSSIWCVCVYICRSVVWFDGCGAKIIHICGVFSSHPVYNIFGIYLYPSFCIYSSEWNAVYHFILFNFRTSVGPTKCFHSIRRLFNTVHVIISLSFSFAHILMSRLLWLLLCIFIIFAFWLISISMAFGWSHSRCQRHHSSYQITILIILHVSVSKNGLWKVKWLHANCKPDIKSIQFQPFSVECLHVLLCVNIFVWMKFGVFICCYCCSLSVSLDCFFLFSCVLLCIILARHIYLFKLNAVRAFSYSHYNKCQISGPNNNFVSYTY